MKLRAGLLALLVLSLAGYGGAKYYVHAKVKSKLDELVRLASPFAQISYGKITSDLRGKLQVESISLRSSEGAAVQIGGIAMEGPGPGFLWDLLDGFKNSEPPERVVLKLSGVSIPVDQSISSSLGPINLDGTRAIPVQTQPCTLGGLLKHAGLEQLGIDYLVANAVLGYNFSKPHGEAQVFLEYDLTGIESMSLAMSLHGIPETGAVVRGVMPLFADIDLTYSLQAGHSRRLVSHCSQEAKQTTEQYLDAVFTQSDNQIARDLGFVPGPGIKSLLRKLIASGGTVHLTANPAGDMDPGTLSAYKPEDILRLLNVAVSMDGKPVEDLSFAFAPSGLFPQEGEEISAEDSMDESIPAGSPAEATEIRTERRRLRYLETAVSDLHLYVGSRVKLYTVESTKPKTGFLVSHKGDIYSVEQSIHGGTMTAHVRISEISRAEVLRLLP
ncbi:MAG: hypothetical protein H6964_02695 [Chromatiaceae bacterium]|nr:hypothetical protein [Chromatiaceae bacterium]MCP5445887.1 hypothetical protein [Chromatiaceae bacterium]